MIDLSAFEKHAIIDIYTPILILILDLDGLPKTSRNVLIYFVNSKG